MESVVSGGAHPPPSGGISNHPGIIDPMDNTQILWMGKIDKISQVLWEETQDDDPGEDGVENITERQGR